MNPIASFDATSMVGIPSFLIANDVNTEDLETVKSNLDNTASIVVGSKKEDTTNDYPRTRKFPEVLSDKMLDIDNHERFMSIYCARH